MQVTNLMVIFLLSLLLLGCGSGGSGGSTDNDAPESESPSGPDAESPSPDDTTAPELTSSTPSNGDISVDVNPTLTATFNEPLMSSSVNENSVLLIDSSGNNVVGEASLSMDSTSVSFVPGSRLNLEESYDFTLTSSIADVAGNNLTSDQVVNFSIKEGQWQSSIFRITDTNAPANEIDTLIADDGDIWAIYMDKANTKVESVQIDDSGSETYILENDIPVTGSPAISQSNEGLISSFWPFSDLGRGRPAASDFDSISNAWLPKVNLTSYGNSITAMKSAGMAGERHVLAAPQYDADGRLFMVIYGRGSNGNYFGGQAQPFTNDIYEFAVEPENDPIEATVVWRTNDNDGVYAARLEDPGSLGDTVRLNTTAANVVDSIAIAESQSGTVTVAWTESRSTGSVLSVISHTGNGVWGDVQELAAPAAGARLSQVEVAYRNNQAALVWKERVAADDQDTIYYLSQDSEGVWQSPEVVVSENGPSTTYESYGFTFTPDDQPVVVVSGLTPVDSDVLYRISLVEKGESEWQTPTMLDAPAGEQALFVELEKADNGEMLLSWVVTSDRSAPDYVEGIMYK